jgi:general secretion pathway protein J
MNTEKGFTLIEILIALVIFAILASTTSSILYYSFTARTKVNAQADRLNQLQMAINLIQQETTQMVDRKIRGNEMHLFPAFVGQGSYVEFTRDGVVNPNSQEKRSTLKRIALLCLNDALIQRTWSQLDPLNINQYEEKILIDNLAQCQFNFLNKSLQVLSDWREQTADQNNPQGLFPKAIQLNLRLKDWGDISLLFIIPGALYDSGQ